MISGNQSKEMEILLEESDSFGKGILASSTNPFEAWTGYFTIWYPNTDGHSLFIASSPLLENT
jgi:hypothetical protein